MGVFDINTFREIYVDMDGECLGQEDIFEESMELKESICSENGLKFGCCEASIFKLRLINRFVPVMGKKITVIFKGDGEEYRIGNYKVKSDVPTADLLYRDITAYDAMYDIINADVTAWYNSILPDKDSTVTMKQFRESFIRHFGLTEATPENGLINDDMVVEKTIDIVENSNTESDAGQVSAIGEALSGRDVITAICEINGCFGHIGRDGKFHYIYLQQAIAGLYPRNDLYPADSLYPRNPKGTRLGTGTYINCQYEDFTTQGITQLQIRQEENDIGLIYGGGDNCYIIEGNFLVYGKSSDQLQKIAKKIYEQINAITYRPITNCACIGNPCLEVGDPIRLSTKHELIETYILERTLKGIQALIDTYQASGIERYARNVNGVKASILQLQGKSNILKRTIEETRLEMRDLGAGLYTEISATAAGIRADVAKTYETKTDASAEYTSIRSSISVEAGRITSEINRATKAEQTLSGQITSTSKELSSKIEQTESTINLSVDQKIQETRSYADTQATNAKNDSNYATDEKLKSYSTTVQMNAAIKVATDSINLSVSQSIEETKTYADTQATAAKNAANTETDNKLKSYSTTTQMNSAIKIATDSINLSVNSKIEETKTYADTQATAAKDAANTNTSNLLKSYSTTVQMNSAIKVATDGITSTVSETYETKTNASRQYTALSSSITQTSNSITAEVTRAKNAESDLSSRITVTENGITTKVSKGDISSEISQEAGSISIKSDRLTIDSTYFKLSNDGKITSTGGTIGGFTIGSKAIYSDSSVLGNNGVYLGTDGISVSGTGGVFKVQSNGSTYIKTYDDIEIWKSTSRTVISGASISVYGSSTSSLAINSNSLTFSGSGSIKISSAEVIGITASSVTVGGSQYTYIGKSGNQLGFFGTATKSAKKTVSKASTSSTVAASAVATVVNNLIDALKAYNLIG